MGMRGYQCGLQSAFLAWLLVAPAAAQEDSQTPQPRLDIAPIQEAVSFFNPRFSSDLRLRYQSLDVDDFAQDSDALTLRFLGGVEIDVFDKTSIIAEVEAVGELVDDFNDGTGNNPLLPVIPDPEGIELNRFQISSEIIPKTRVTLGRQRIAIDDWRFIGEFPFRQNSQTFDAARLETKAFGPGILDVGYFNRVRRPLGDDNDEGVFSGDSFFANYNLATPIGRVSAFHYSTELVTGVDDEIDESTRTTGVRVFGRRDYKNLGIAWEGAYARQTDFADNPNDYAADYYLADLTVTPGRFKFKARGEILGSDNGQGLQTPLASLHGFQGFADQFLVTPDDGVRDYSILAGYDFGTVGPFSNVSTFARHHWFEADTTGVRYGREIDLSLKAKINRVGFALEYTHYNAETFSSDTEAVFLTTEISF